MSGIPKDKLEGLELEALEELEHAFVKDLEFVFEGKHLEFGTHLQGMLFDLWYRAHGVPKGTVKELEELKSHVRKLELGVTDMRDHVRKELLDQFPALLEQFKSKFEQDVSYNLQNGLLDVELATALGRVVQMQGDKTHTLGYVSGGQYILPEVTDIPFSTLATPTTPSPNHADSMEDLKDKLQDLKDKLQEIGAWAPANANFMDDWVPCLINKETGRVAGVNFPDSCPSMFFPTTVSMYLTYSSARCRWEFPIPRPPIHKGYWNGENVRLYIHGQHFDSSQCDWDYNAEIESVIIPGHTENNGSVRAEYTVIDIV